MSPPAIAYAALASTGLPALAGGFFWKRSSNAIKVFTALCCITVIEVSISYALGRSGIRNNVVSNYYRLIEVVLLLWCYLLWLRSQALVRITKLVGVIFFLSWLADEVWFPNTSQINSVMAIVARLVIIGATIALFSDILSSSNIPFLKHPMFWIGAGELLYCCGTILVLAFSNITLKLGMSYFTALWYVNWGAAILSNILYARSFFVRNI